MEEEEIADRENAMKKNFLRLKMGKLMIERMMPLFGWSFSKNLRSLAQQKKTFSIKITEMHKMQAKALIQT